MTVLKVIGYCLHMAMVFAGVSAVLALIIGSPIEERVILGLMLGAGTGFFLRAEELGWIKPTFWKYQKKREQAGARMEELAQQREDMLREARAMASHEQA